MRTAYFVWESRYPTCKRTLTPRERKVRARELQECLAAGYPWSEAKEIIDHLWNGEYYAEVRASAEQDAIDEGYVLLDDSLD